MSERVLLDSNAVYWFAFEPERLSPRARQALQDESHQLLISPFTIVEFAWKASRNQLRFDTDVATWVRAQVVALDALEVPFSTTHAASFQSLPWHHRDPFDRMLIAQAMAEGAAIVTADRVFARYPVEVIW